MPYINVRLARKDITTEQKAQSVLDSGSRPWGYAGELTSVHRQRQG